jgi:hypothetical protein
MSAKKFLSIVLILIPIVMGIVAWYLAPPWNFIAMMILMLLFVAVLGVRISGRPAGILVNERNLMSLTRFQLVMWTILILAAFMTAAIARMRGKDFANALNIDLDKYLWGLLGISTASLVGSPLLQSGKTAQTPKSGEVAKTETALAANGDDVPKEEISSNRKGVLFANASIADARFSDMFEGDEVVNTAYVDVAKVQMFFFTVVAGLSYGIELYQWIAQQGYLHDPAKTAFPVVSGSLVAILGISHAGFLVSKSTTQTPTQGS